MNKPFTKLLGAGLALCLTLGLGAAVSAEDGPAVVVSPQALTIDGAAATCEKYNIDGDNYFKLRDLAALLSDGETRFEVGYDEGERTAIVTTGEAYTPVGGELDAGEDKSDTCVESDWKLIVDGVEINAKAYNIDGSNYFRLRDLGNAIGFGVDYDEESNTAVVISAKSPIQSVTAIGFVDLDGAKLKAIAVEYGVDLTGAALDQDTFAVDVNVANGYTNTGDGADVGDVLKFYVNDAPEISENGGSGSGNYVILELFTDYLNSSEQQFTASLACGVTQMKDIAVGETVIAAHPNEIKNYTEKQSFNNFRQEWTTVKAIDPNSFILPELDSFKFYTNQPGDYGADGPAFVATNCFDEKDGTFYETFPVAYALSLPEDYTENGKYAMVVLDNPAANEGTHPLTSVLETRSPSVYASEWAQELVKEKHGLDGLIVVVPVVTARVDDNACSPAQYDALVQLWDYLIETYHVDADHVYGSGQSVGGMVLLETQRNRDNYFAGLMLYEDQWAQNYYKDGLFIRNMLSDEKTAATAPFHYPRTNGDLTWDYSLDTNGEKVTEGHDPNNYYYLISDDNILIMNRTANNLSNDTWRELAYLYEDLTGAEVKQHIVAADLSLAERDADIAAYLNREESGNDLTNFNWVSIENGANGYSCRQVMAGYEWLLSQERQDEIAREKLDLNKPFALADEQLQTEARATHFTDAEGNTIYYLTGAAGAGTQFYNTCWLNLGKIADAAPGWLPEGMSWETGVSGAEIKSVAAIGADAVAIEYSADMTGLVVNLKGDDIVGLDGKVREDIKIALDPFDFYDAEGNKLDVTIKNIYVNDSAAAVEGAERQSGSGNYVIVELEGADGAAVAGVVQRTTLRTDLVFAEPSAKRYDV